MINGKKSLAILKRDSFWASENVPCRCYAVFPTSFQNKIFMSVHCETQNFHSLLLRALHSVEHAQKFRFPNCVLSILVP